MVVEAEARSFHACQVEYVERQWFEAFRQHDTTTLDGILADDYIFIGPNGQVRTKAAMRKLNWLEYERVELDEVRVRVYGEAAVLTARLVIHGRTGDGQSSGTYRHTRVYIRRRGEWRAVSGQSTKVASG